VALICCAPSYKGRGAPEVSRSLGHPVSGCHKYGDVLQVCGWARGKQISLRKILSNAKPEEKQETKSQYLSKTNKIQRYTTVFITINALHVSGGSSAHHQELKPVYTAIGYLSSFFCFLPLSWVSWNNDSGKKQKKLDKYPMLCIQFWAPDDGRRNRL